MPKKSEHVRELIAAMRARNAPTIDGSYVYCSQVVSQQFAQAAHEPLTPDQIEAEKIAKERPNVRYVYFIRDEERPAPYWVSPPRTRDVVVEGEIEGSVKRFVIRHLIIDVARSRKERHARVEVAIPLGQIQAKKTQRERDEFVLDYVRKAIAQVLGRPAAAA